MDECRKNIQTFLERKLDQWSGLNADCHESTLHTWLPFNQGAGSAHLGADYVTYTFRAAIYAGFERSVFFYFQKGLLRMIATEYWSFDREECVQIKERLGTPEHQLDFSWRNLKFENGEYVYHNRGLALGVVPDTQLIVSVVVYPPCTLEVYQAKYHNIASTREFIAEQ